MSANNKLILNKSVKLSGQNMLWGLGLGLSISAIALDSMSDRLLSSASVFLPLAICAIVTAALGYWTIPILRQLKAGQIIREDGPQAHLQKAGTPTMGGVFFVPVAVAIALLLSKFNPNVIAICTLTAAYSFIGWLDDWQILRRKSNKGISAKIKLALQIAFAALFCIWLAWSQPVTITNLALPFGLILPLGLLFWPLAIFAQVAESNATNLTDGVDGLIDRKSVV